MQTACRGPHTHTHYLHGPYVIITAGSARSLPGRPGGVSVQVHHADETGTCRPRRRSSHVAAMGRPSCPQSATVLPSVAAAPTAAGGRSYPATQWLSPEDATAGGRPAETSSNSQPGRRTSPAEELDVDDDDDADAGSLSQLDVQLETLNRSDGELGPSTYAVSASYEKTVQCPSVRPTSVCLSVPGITRAWQQHSRAAAAGARRRLRMTRRPRKFWSGCNEVRHTCNLQVYGYIRVTYLLTSCK